MKLLMESARSTNYSKVSLFLTKRHVVGDSQVTYVPAGSNGSKVTVKGYGWARCFHLAKQDFKIPLFETPYALLNADTYALIATGMLFSKNRTVSIY